MSKTEPNRHIHTRIMHFFAFLCSEANSKNKTKQKKKKKTNKQINNNNNKKTTTTYPINFRRLQYDG